MVNTNTKETKKRGKIIEIKLIHIIAVIIFIAIIATIFIKLQQNIQKSNTEITPEILRSRSYDAVNNGDEATNSEYVKFDAFFLKDIDLDGNADAIRGTCNEVGKEDTLYMDLKVINNGYFKNGKITINSNNFYLNTTIVKDSIIKANYISNNTKTIDLKEMQNGSQKLLTGIVRSGDYTSQYKKTEAIGNDTTKYSKINSITFTGTHVDDNGVETPINKTINFNVDWYGTTTAGISVSDVKNTVNSFDELLNGENMVLNFTIKTEEKDNDLILKKSYLEGTIPELNGYKPISVEFEGDRITYEYNQETGAFTAQREAIVNENQTVTGIVNTSSYIEKRYNEYKVKVIYPKEAYENMEENSVQLLIPVKTYYEGYNNQNTEFTNPYVSNTAEATIVARWVKYEGFAYRFDITVGKYVASPYSRYVVSKEKPLKIFNNISEQEKDDYYTVRWQLTTGTEGISTGTTMKETKTGSEQAHDNFIKTDSSKETMEELTSNVGIYFSGADGMLGEDGWIKVYNDTTNELIETFTKENWNTYNESNPYRYENAIKHIRVETSATNVNSSFTVYNVKELDDQYITENYTREEFDKLEYINSNLTGTFGTNSSTVTHSAHYEAPLSVASINISKQILSTQETTENQIITIKTETNQYNEQKWKNGTFLVKVPSEIINMEINSVTVDKNRVAILGYDLFEQDGNYYIKVLTENENEETYNINIDCNMTPDPRNTTVTRDIELYAINEQGVDYYYKGNDIYDIDGDLNTEEILNYTKKAINLISPNELLTNQIASNYDDKNSTTIAPRVAKVEKSQRTAEININLTNNYAQDITNVILQGVIPFEGNQFIVGNRELGSQFTTNITNSGIIVPNELVDYTTVYYSTQEKPSNDINDTNNNWKTANEVTDWNSIKTYIISLGDYVLHSKDSHTFKYTINIPEGVNYNEIAYSEHAINFALMTDAGKYNTYTASDKLGFMIAKQYDLEIEKLQENTDKKLQGITFKVTEEGKEESKIRVTDNDGRVKIYGLCAEKTYIIKEIKTTSDYVINEEEIKVYTYTDNEDNLHVAYKNDNGSYTNLEEKYSWLKSAIVHKNDGEDYKVKLQLENEPKARLKIIKNTGAQNLSGVRFKLTGKEKDNNLTTNSNGEINVSGLYLNEEYTLQEVTAKGYYLPNTPIKFTLNTNMNLQITGERITSSSVTKTDEIPTINIQIDNEKIPEYSLKIIKKEKDTETLLQGTQFTLTGEDKSENTIYTTDENGEIQIDNLYQFVEEKNITATYTLKEIYPTEGYVLNNEPLVFKAQKNNSELELQIESGSIRGEAEIDYTNPDNPVITITLDNNPSFTLTKVDEDTNQPLEGVDFQITDMNDNTVTDVNGKDLSKVTTDENGKINLSLGQGLYKAKETKQLPGYEAPELYTGIGIGESKEAEYNVKFDKLNNRFSYCSFNNITEVEGGVIAVGVAGQVVKYDQSGNIEWENTDKTNRYCGVTTVEGGVIAVGNGGQVVKYDQSGNTEWENTTKSYNYQGVTEVEGGVIAVGNGGQVVKYDQSGNIEWENTEKSYYYKGVTEVEGGVIAVGYNGQVVKYDQSGNIEWENTTKNYGYNGVTEVEGGVIAVSNRGQVVKYDLEGNIEWENTAKRYTYVEVTKVEGGIIAVGYNGQVVKYDQSGNIEWENKEKTYEYEGVTSVEGGVIAVGNGGQAVKYDQSGNIEWENIEKSYRYQGVTEVEEGRIAVSWNGQVVKYDQSGNIEWKNIEKSYHYRGVTTVEGGVIAVGLSGKVVKYDQSGNIEWENTTKSYSYSGVTGVEGGVIAVGVAGQVVKYDQSGNIEWENTDKTNRYCGVTTVEGGVIAVGNGGQVVKYDQSGNTEWENTTKSYNYQGVTEVEGGVIAVGNGGQVVKYDQSGNIEWENTEKSYYYKGVTEVEGGVIAVGVAGQVVKYDQSGNIEWENTTKNYGYNGVTEVEGGVIAVGRSGKVVKYDQSGNIEWENTDKTYNYQGVTTVEGEVIAVGEYGKVVKYDQSGNIEWENTEKSYSYYGVTTVEGGAIAVGDSGKIVKYDQSGNIEWENTEKSYNFNGVVETNDGLILATENDGIALYKKVITSPEIPDAQNVTVTNKKKRVKITTEVEGTGGSITGQNEAPYEEVKYGEDSVKEIKAVPSDGYSVVKITVNGEEIDFTENDDTTVTLSKFIEMTEDKHVVVTFSDNVSAIEVNHYLWTPSSGVTTTKVADSSTQKGNIDDNYSTVPKFDIEYEIVKNKDIYRNKTEDEIISEINTQYGTTYTSVTDLGYTEITDHEDDNYGKTPFEQFMQDYYIPENATGEFKAETQEINYYYKEITYTLTVKHLIEGTEESVPSITGGTVEDEITDNYSKNSEYETTNSNQVDYSKYQLVEVPENATGTIQGDTEVRYYYRQIEHQITTKVQEHEETNIYGIVEQVKGGTITGEGELPYETVAHGEDSVKDIKAVPEENYEVKSITVNGTPIEFTANADGTVTLAKFIEVTEDKEVIVEFQKKEGRVIIHHYEEGTTTPITLNNGDTATDIVKTGRIGEVYASQPHENAAIKYKVTNATPERSSGRFIDGTIEVTYYYSIRKVEVTVNKVWDDNNNSLEIRPESVRVNLKATIGTESTGIQDVTESVISTDIQKEISLNSGNNWEHTWDNLLQYTEDSQEITYNIEEESFTGNLAIVYSSEVTKDASNPYSLTVTNTYTRPTEKINYVVTKIWDDNSNENGKRPDNLVFDIYKIGENDSRTKVTTYTLNTLSETSHTFELDRYDEKGNEINYVAEEAEKNEGDLHLYTQSGGEKQDITTSGKKTYKSEFTNKFEVPDENVNIEVTKQWDDENNSNQKRPSSIKLVLYRVETLGTGTSATSRNEKVTEYTLDTPSNSNTFEYTFENQPKYDEHGNEITYIVDEEEVNEDDLKLYTKTVQETEENKYNIKNTFTVPDEKIEIEATKVWNEQNDTQKQKRPTSVILKLMNGTETVKSTAVNAQNSWKTTFSDLAKYDETGDEIDYRLAEEEVNTDDLKFYTSAESSSLQRVDDTHYKLTLTNTFGIPNDKIELKVTKAWDDEDGKDRLSSLKLVLTGNGQRYEHILTEANEDSTNSNNWIYTFTNLPKYDSNGEEITYALTEEEVNTGDLEKYITSVDGYTVTNKLKIRDTKIEKTGTTEITSLSDKVNYTINYEAKIDTNYTGTCKVTITDTLPYEIDEAQEYNLNEGTYTAENKTIKWEENVTPTDGKISITKQISFAYKDLPLNIDKFTNKVEGKIECENNITETKEIEWDTIVNFKRNIIVTKEWKGDTTSTQRPEEVEIELRKDGDVEETRQIKLANNWKETFENLNKYDETTRAEIAYTVTENNVPEGYYVEITTEDVSSTGANNLGFKVTNNKYGAIKVTKVDQNDNTKKIGGAEFTLTKLKWENEKWVEDSSYKKVETTSQEETKLGLAEFKNLVYGKYRLQETKAPEGYELIRETMDIDINETNTNYETIVQNKEKTTLPATGAYTKIAAIALGCLLIIVAIRIRNKRHSHY